MMIETMIKYYDEYNEDEQQHNSYFNVS